jgi:CDP-glucose 4,6-dehydratase
MEGLVRPDPGFWAGRRVLLTGHTGFKGAWAARMLAALGARVTGFALDPEPGPSAFVALGAGRGLVADLRGDLRDAAAVVRAVQGQDIVLHLAAQAIVSQGLRDPAGTWSANLTGTLNLLQALRGAGAGAAVIVTSDKVYRQPGQRPFAEGDALGGDDPYSASKAACEIVVASHRASFADLPPLATARAGNVIGGGDFGADRLIPDLVRAQGAGVSLALRAPDSTRPFQHVLGLLAGYLLLAQALVRGAAPQAVNFGPAQAEVSVRDVIGHWEHATGRPVDWHLSGAPPLPDKPRLALDSSLAARSLGWRDAMGPALAVADTARWYGAWAAGADMAAPSDQAIHAWLEERE